jgi:hypothetical protein
MRTASTRQQKARIREPKRQTVGIESLKLLLCVSSVSILCVSQISQFLWSLQPSLFSISPDIGFKEEFISREIAHDPQAVVEVVIWPEKDYPSEFDHVYQDGISRSPFLLRNKNFTRFLPNEKNSSIETVWLGILYSGGYDEYDNWCKHFGEKVKKAQAECRRQGRWRCFWHIHIVQFSDWVERDKSCKNIDALMTSVKDGIYGKDLVHYSQRSIVAHRYWSEASQWISPGYRLDLFSNSEPAVAVAFPSIGITTTGLHRHRHMNYPVRSDIVKTFETRIERLHGREFSFLGPIERLWNRPIDIAHFWPVEEMDKDDSFYPRLRWTISDRMNDYCASRGRDEDTLDPVSCFIDTVGLRREDGRRGTDSSYVDTMLSSKIVVVSQRDDWEDHYRLMEAMVSGAMIMTDAMLTLPDGYENGVSLIEFNSVDDLLSKIDYYLDPKHASQRLAIAKEGRKLALERHRSWHRMEELIFGQILTTPELTEELMTSSCIDCY